MAPRDVKLVDGETEAPKTDSTKVSSIWGTAMSVVSLGATSKSHTLTLGVEGGEEGERASP